MPAVHFTIQLPDGVKKTCYSPSTVVQNYFTSGQELALEEFLGLSRTAYAEASERVRARFGYACSAAADQLAEIELWSRQFPQGGVVRIIAI